MSAPPFVNQAARTVSSGLTAWLLVAVLAAAFTVVIAASRTVTKTRGVESSRINPAETPGDMLLRFTRLQPVASWKTGDRQNVRCQEWVSVGASPRWQNTLCWKGAP